MPEPEPEPEQLYYGDTGDLQVALRLAGGDPSTHQMSWAARELERYLLCSTNAGGGGGAPGGGGLAGQRVLELKAGRGWLARRLSAHGASVVATESGALLPALQPEHLVRHGELQRAALGEVAAHRLRDVRARKRRLEHRLDAAHLQALAAPHAPS